MSDQLLRHETLDQLFAPLALSFEDFRNDIHAVYAFGKSTGCASFDGQLPTLSGYRNYLRRQPNIYLAEDAQLPDDTYGVVMKLKEEINNNRVIDMFYLLVNTALSDEFLKVFTLAHELGHIFLHGRLLAPGMSTRRRDLEWHRDGRYRTMMELEANLFALLSLIPQSAIEVARATADQKGHDFVLTLWRFVSHLYRRSIDIGLITERLLVDDVLNGRYDRSCLELRYQRLISHRTWLIDGLTPSVPTRCAGSFRNAVFQLEPRCVDDMEIELKCRMPSATLHWNG